MVDCRHPLVIMYLLGLACLVSLSAVASAAQNNHRCVSDCSGLSSGNYQSCQGCDVYVACTIGFMLYERPCPAGLVWDDKLKQCDRTSTTCPEVAGVASRLTVSFNVIENIDDVSTCDVTLRNTDSALSITGEWDIYVCMIRMFTDLNQDNGVKTEGYVIPNSGLRVFHINGCLFKLVPTSDWQAIPAGGSMTFRIRLDFWMVTKTDVIHNWYLVDREDNVALLNSTSDLDFVQPFTSAKQWKRSPADKFNPYTPQSRYDLYENQQKPAVVLKTEDYVIPQPASMAFTGSIPFFHSDWVILTNTGFTNEIRLAKLLFHGLRESSTKPAAKYIELEISSDITVPGVQCSSSNEAYKVNIHSGDSSHITITAGTNTGVFYALQTIYSLNKVLTASSTLPAGLLQDCPRYPYRGLMLDVGRNFHSKDSVIKTIDQMAQYKLNKLHLHLTDDEGWRLEIPGLPELTTVGSIRKHCSTDDCVLPQLGSDPTAEVAPGSGYYSVAEYKEILQYAKDRHIQVIPEFDMPGHGHAAIKAMQYRSNTTGNDEYLLNDPEDTSVYLSVQMFNDNAINPCIDSTYTFIEKIITEIKKMHSVIQPLDMFHFGGDEVAPTAWTKSPKCIQRENRPKVDKDLLKLNFTQELSKLANAQNMALGAWEDGMADHDGNPYNISTLATDDVTVYAWSNIWEWGQGDRAYRLANAGYKVVLAHATHLYLDHPSEPDPEDRGYYWATRFTDTRKSFGYSPVDIYLNMDTDRMGNKITKEEICKSNSCATLDNPDNIIGMQAQLWTEVTGTPAELEGMLWPRMLAVAERAWHKADWEDIEDIESTERKASMEKDWKRFASSVGKVHLPLLDLSNVSYKLEPPGVRLLQDLTLEVLTEFPGMKVVMKRNEGTDAGQWVDFNASTTFTKDSKVQLATRYSAAGSGQSRAVEVTVNTINN